MSTVKWKVVGVRNGIGKKSMKPYAVLHVTRDMLGGGCEGLEACNYPAAPELLDKVMLGDEVGLVFAPNSTFVSDVY